MARSNNARLGVERLEAREMPAARLTAWLSNDGMLRVEGTERNDTILVRQTANRISVYGAYIQTGSARVSSVVANTVKGIDVKGLGGNDTIRLDRGTQAIQVGAKLDGGLGRDTLAGGAGADTLVVSLLESDRVFRVGDRDRLDIGNQTGIRKTAIRPTDGAVFVLTSDNWLAVNGKKSSANTRDFYVARNGTVVWLSMDGALEIQRPGTASKRISTTVHEIALQNDKIYWREGDNGRLYEQAVTSNSYRMITSTVHRFAVADNKIFWVEGDNNRLYEMPTTSGNYRQITATVKTFDIADGKLFWIEGDNNRLYDMPTSGGSYRLITSTVREFKLADGKVFWVEGDNNRLYQQPISNGSYSMITSTVKSFQIADGKLFWIEGAENRLYEIPTTGGNYRQITSTVKYFMVANRQLYWVEGDNDRLYVQPTGAGNYRLLGTDVSAFSINPDGSLRVASKLRQGSTPNFANGNFAVRQSVYYNPTNWAPDGYKHTHAVQGNSNTCTIVAAIASAAAQKIDLSWRIKYSGNNWYQVYLYEFGWVNTYFDGRIDGTDIQPVFGKGRIADASGNSTEVPVLQNLWAILFFRAYTNRQARVDWRHEQASDESWYRPFGLEWPGVPWHSEKNAGFAMAGGDKNNWDTSEGSRAIYHLRNNLQLGSVVLVRTTAKAYGGTPNWFRWLDQSIGANHVWAVLGMRQESNGTWMVHLYNPWGKELLLTWSQFDIGFHDITMVTRVGVEY